MSPRVQVVGSYLSPYAFIGDVRFTALRCAASPC